MVYAGDLRVHAGNRLTPRQVKDQPPIVRWPAASNASASDEFYTLMLCDPDAPSATDARQREVLHWCVVNIRGGDLRLGGGRTLFEYIGSGAPEHSGLHRYVFVVFRQPGRHPLEFEEEVEVPRTLVWNSIV